MALYTRGRIRLARKQNVQYFTTLPHDSDPTNHCRSCPVIFFGFVPAGSRWTCYYVSPLSHARGKSNVSFLCQPPPEYNTRKSRPCSALAAPVACTSHPPFCLGATGPAKKPPQVTRFSIGNVRRPTTTWYPLTTSQS